MNMKPSDIKKVKKEHPNALLLAHPECLSEVVGMADYVGSTTGIMDYAKESDAGEFIIATEQSIVEHLQIMAPTKKFYLASIMAVCHNMKVTSLMDVLNVLKGQGGEEIIMDKALIEESRRPIDRMIELGG